MGSGTMTMGNVEISHGYDLIVDFPITLDQLFPTVSSEMWEPYRRAYPDLFGPGNAWRWHAGWNLELVDGEYRPTFPRARNVAHRADWETFQRSEVQRSMEGFAPAFVPQTLTPLEVPGALDLIDGERGLTSEVTTLDTPGHTPGSMSLLTACHCPDLGLGRVVRLEGRRVWQAR
jgi:hypothetical protein